MTILAMPFAGVLRAVVHVLVRAFGRVLLGQNCIVLLFRPRDKGGPLFIKTGILVREAKPARIVDKITDCIPLTGD